MAGLTGMIGVDVGGTFTDVVCDRATARSRPPRSPRTSSETYPGVLEGAARGRRRGLRGVQPRQHARAQRDDHAAAAEDRLPDHDGPPRHPRHGPGLAAARSADRSALAALVRRRGGAPIVPRYLRRGVTRAHHGRRRGACRRSTRSDAREQLRCSAAATSQGVAICLLNAYVNPAHEERLRELVREELGDIACSISSAVSPLASEYARASTTVIDVLMKIIYGAVHRAARHGARASSASPGS